MGFLYAQYKPSIDTSDRIILEKEISGGIKFHTQGWGVKFTRGNNKTVFKRNTWQIEFVGMNPQKQVKVINPYYYASNYYVFGKLNSVFLLNAALGKYHQINRKPYWGGVELRYFYQYGINIGIAKPIYLYIYDPAQGILIEDQYDLSKYSDSDIVRKAPFLSGIDETTFYPGIHLETGLDFEFGAFNTNLTSLTVGTTLDFFPFPIPIMASNDPEFYFLTLFLNLNLGKRYN